jgi:CysZ protein
MSPLLALLSERVENILTAKNYPFRFNHFISDVLRGILLALRNLFLEVLLFIVVSILSFIPVVNLICPFLSFYISGYFYGFSMLDYSNERKRFTIKRSIHFIRMQRGVAFGNGAVFYLMLMIPFVGWLIAPAYSVTAAAIAGNKINLHRE